MSCDYKINGEMILRRSAEVLDEIESLKTEILEQNCVEVETIDEQTLLLRVDYDDVNTVNTPDYVNGFLDSIAPFVVGSAAFEITTSGENRTVWLGEEKAVRKEKSLAALRLIEECAVDLLSEDIDRGLDLLRHRQQQM